MKNPLLYYVDKRKQGIHCGIPSFCCANKMVIEAILEQAKRFDDIVLIEATSNQVNQEGGYTNMQPEDFKAFVYHIADKIDFPHEKIILGGDHLGPQPWQNEPEDIAMEKSKRLVELAVLSGYKKIHLDTSMRLGSDPADEPLRYETVAARGAELYKVCMDAYHELLKENPQEVCPVFVIGSEVPIPGGAQQKEDKLKVTEAYDFERVLTTYQEQFALRGIENAWDNIIAVVVQPGVEFGSNMVHHYDRQEARALCRTLRKYPSIVFEGHSTDYQSPAKLREMVEDGIAIIKVGPALTFALREALFALSMIEQEYIPDAAQRADLPQVLNSLMEKDPSSWKNHYHEAGIGLEIEKRYSLSDRCRYYFAEPAFEEAMQKLFANIDSLPITLGILHQYLPVQYQRVRDGVLPLKAEALVKDHINELVDEYNYAVRANYLMNRTL